MYHELRKPGTRPKTSTFYSRSTHPLRRSFDRIDNIAIAGTAAKHCRNRFANLLPCRVGIDAQEIDRGLPDAENKVWHAHPVWFLDGNPIVGYSKLKDSVRLLFWSGQSFDEDDLEQEGSFKAAEARYTAIDQVDAKKLKFVFDEYQYEYDMADNKLTKGAKAPPRPAG